MQSRANLETEPTRVATCQVTPRRCNWSGFVRELSTINRADAQSEGFFVVAPDQVREKQSRPVVFSAPTGRALRLGKDCRPD
jgi:hypothetical protein